MPIGGAGIDTAFYRDRAGVTVNLAIGTGTRGHAEGGTLVEIEDVYGSNGSDSLIGDDGNNLLFGGLKRGMDLLRAALVPTLVNDVGSGTSGGNPRLGLAGQHVVADTADERALPRLGREFPGVEGVEMTAQGP